MTKWSLLGFLTAAAVGIAAVTVESEGKAPSTAATQSVDSGHKDYERTTLNKTFQIEWAAFTGVVEWLDGPAREGMGRQMGGSSLQGCLRGMQSDKAGNLYMCDMTSGMIRALRKRDGMLLTLSGNGHITAGRPPEKEGPAYRLCLDQLVYIAAVGEPLEGKGSLYLATEGQVLRLFRDEARGGRWWYERAAGGGKTNITAPGEYAATDVRLSEPRVLATEDGRIGVMRPHDKGQLLFWLKDGKLIPAYDENLIAASAPGGKFFCYGIDGKGNFVGSNHGWGDGATHVVVVAPDGKTVKAHRMPFPVSWGVYPDCKRENWFVKGGDHYTITRVTPDGTTATLKADGSWHEHKPGGGGRAYNIRDGVQWMWCQPLQDGRMVGWNSHGCLPLFLGAWLERE